MQASGPHYLLFTDADSPTSDSSRWRFVLQPMAAGERVVASDAEADADSMRLALLAVVRGLEALDAPSRVTLLVANRFVRRGIRRDLAQWKERGWRWERFGQLVPIRDLDLWKRIDRALSIHQVDCFAWNAVDQEAEPGQFVAPSHSAAGDANQSYPQRRQDVAHRRQRTFWRHEMLSSLTGLGRTALSRTA